MSAPVEDGKYVVNRSLSPARARSKRRSVAARARAGPTWDSERISSVARVLARERVMGARRKGRAGRWQLGKWSEQICPPTRLEPAAAGRMRARGRKKTCRTN